MPPRGCRGTVPGTALYPRKLFKKILGNRLEGTFECKARLENADFGTPAILIHAWVFPNFIFSVEVCTGAVVILSMPCLASVRCAYLHWFAVCCIPFYPISSKVHMTRLVVVQDRGTVQKTKMHDIVLEAVLDHVAFPEMKGSPAWRNATASKGAMERLRTVHSNSSSRANWSQ